MTTFWHNLTLTPLGADEADVVHAYVEDFRRASDAEEVVLQTRDQRQGQKAVSNRAALFTLCAVDVNMDPLMVTVASANRLMRV